MIDYEKLENVIKDIYAVFEKHGTDLPSRELVWSTMHLRLQQEKQRMQTSDLVGQMLPMGRINDLLGGKE